MKRLGGALSLMLAGCLVAACGIQPGPVDINGRPEGGAGTNSSTEPVLTRPEHITDAIALVSRFLEAAADDVATREATLRSFLQPEEQWKPGSVINLVHVLEITKPTLGGEVVRVKVQYVGELNARGIIEPTAREQETIDFQIVDLPGRGVYLEAPRPELLFSDSGLRSYFDARPIYFWDNTGSELVPDLRYVPRYLTEEEKGKRLVDFLYEGPASWLDVTVSKLPAATKPLDRVVLGENKTIVVNLSTQPTLAEQALLIKQLAKTLAVQQISGLVLKVQGQAVAPVAMAPPETTTVSPNRYAVVKGVVHRLSVPSGPDNLSLVKLSAEDNKNVAAAAFSRSEGAVMLVHPDLDGQRLSVGRPGAKLNIVALPGLARPKRIAQPIWLDGETGLVLADERLFQVMLDGRAEEIASIGKLIAFSVAPEGRRLALVVGNQLRMAALVHDKGEVSLGQAQPMVPTLLSEVQSVAFGSPTQLVAAGRDEVAVRVVPMNMDGAWQTPSRDELERNLRIVHLVADGRSGNAMYEVEGFGSYQYSFGGSEPLNDKVRLTQGGPSSGPLDVAKTDVRAPSFEG